MDWNIVTIITTKMKTLQQAHQWASCIILNQMDVKKKFLFKKKKRKISVFVMI